MKLWLQPSHFEKMHPCDSIAENTVIYKINLTLMGIVPVSISQPRTPLASASTPRLNTLVTGPQSAPGHKRSYSLNGSVLGSLASGGVREADDTIRDLRKENFNLKLRIYFLDERLGSGASRTSSSTHLTPNEDLLNTNMELKIQCESLKQDVREKTQLLGEASQALDQLEGKLVLARVLRHENFLVFIQGEISRPCTERHFYRLLFPR